MHDSRNDSNKDHTRQNEISRPENYKQKNDITKLVRAKEKILGQQYRQHTNVESTLRQLTNSQKITAGRLSDGICVGRSIRKKHKTALWKIIYERRTIF